MCHRRRIIILLFTVIVIVIPLVVSHAAESENNQQTKQDHTTQETVIIPVSYVTLRNKTGSSTPSEYFGGQRGEFRAGTCSVAFSPIPSLEEIAASAPFYIPDEIIELVDIQETTQDDFCNEIGSFAQQNNGNIVIYVHGYNIDFEKSCRHSALLQRSLAPNDRLLLFSWPTDGNMLKYTWDESDLLWSVPFLADFVSRIVNKVGPGKIDLVAHSLGARGAVQALVRISTLQQKEPVINELVLVAPDVDKEIFKLDFPLIKQVAKRITVYLSENDKALKLSHEVHGYPRLGQAGEFLTVLDGVDTIDISDINNRRISGHLYHLFNPEVIADINQLLLRGIPAAQRPSLKSFSKDGLPYWRMISGNK